MVVQCPRTFLKAVYRIPRAFTDKAHINLRQMRLSPDDNRTVKHRGSRRLTEESEHMGSLTEVKMAERMQVMTEIIQTIVSSQQHSDL